MTFCDAYVHSSFAARLTLTKERIQPFRGGCGFITYFYLNVHGNLATHDCNTLPSIKPNGDNLGQRGKVCVGRQISTCALHCDRSEGGREVGSVLRDVVKPVTKFPKRYNGNVAFSILYLYTVVLGRDIPPSQCALKLI